MLVVFKVLRNKKTKALVFASEFPLNLEAIYMKLQIALYGMEEDCLIHWKNIKQGFIQKE